ncbi:M6 family metalloprotease domain-containing protein [Limnochorda pilosa]|uniref:Peptidase M6 n=1 Tax=Limnochorda pilosa TaxID=1555112 RepID=A0A0K2SNM8_LIMPI|nr:M6 family metalloprotease domain-containing protein [Limnochorda pilosa]BAS28701.1 peptidase M6 [Limnochorda pilosa]
MRRFTRNARWVLVLLVWVFSTSAAGAVPAAPFPAELEQPDGTRFLARPWGDEWLHGWETAHGYTIVTDQAGWWTYARRSASGELVPSSVRVNGAAPTPVEKHLRPAPSLQPGVRVQGLAWSQRAVPPTGTANIPVILINFTDTTTTNTAAEFEELLFGDHPAIATGPGSMKDYYEEISYRVFSVSSGPAGIPDWYTAAREAAYYGANDASGYDDRPGDLVREAVQLADGAIDFSRYDNDGDGRVDVVMIVHQGRGEEAGGGADTIWSHRWNLTSATGSSMTLDGVTIDDYIIQPERLYADMSTIGVFAHEFGHALGLPDLYDTDGGSEGIGEWGLMGGGSWNQVSRPGDAPAHMTAWSKAVLGWLSPHQINGPPATYSIPSAHGSPTALQLRFNAAEPELGGGTGEYFLIENRQKQGFDAGLPGSGLLIWHVDESRTSNTDETHRLVDLEEADGLDHLDASFNRGDPGDPFPGSSNNTEFSATTVPGSLLYDGSDPGFVVTSISASAPTMQAEVGFPGAPVSEIPLTHGPNPARSSATFSFELYGHPATLHVFDVAGRLVHRAPLASDQTEHVWSLTDTAGRPLANGLYLYVVILDDGTRSAVERLVIER